MGKMDKTLMRKLVAGTLLDSNGESYIHKRMYRIGYDILYTYFTIYAHIDVHILYDTYIYFVLLKSRTHYSQLPTIYTDFINKPHLSHFNFL